MKNNCTVVFCYILCFTMVGCSFKNKKQQSAEASTETVDVKPNIIYILADDLGYGDLGVYGQSKFSTPNIDKLAAEGMLFTQHYSGSTVCAPSRSALMTGMHTGHTVVRGNKEIRPEGQYPIPDATFTLAEALKDAGYTTGAFGKWGLGYPGSEGDPVNQGFDRFFGYNCQRFGHNYYPRHLWSNTDSIVLKGNIGKGKGQYAPQLIHEKTLDLIEENKEKPFFLYVAAIIPHAELAAPENILVQHRGKYAPEKAYKGYDDGPQYREGPYESQKESHATFAAMVDLLDRQVGDLVAKIKALNLEKKTLIIFTSDNGPHQEGGADPEYFNSNGALRGHKRDLYDGGIRVPMIARWKGKIPAASKSEHVSAFWDILPTFLELTDGTVPEDIDGISMVPTLLNTKTEQKKHDYLYWEFHEKGGRQAIRKDNWKAVKYNVLKGNSQIELYNLETDIGEEIDLALQYPGKVKEFEKLFANARTPSPVFKFGQDTYLNSK